MALRNLATSIEADDSELDSLGNGRVFRTGLVTMLGGCRAHPLVAAIALVTGLANGASMVLGAIAVGWSIDQLVLPSFAQGSIDLRAAGIAVLAVVGISALRVATIVLRGVATGISSSPARPIPGARSPRPTCGSGSPGTAGTRPGS